MSLQPHVLVVALLCTSGAFCSAQAPRFIFSEPENVLSISSNRWDNMPHVSTNGLEMFYSTDGGSGLGEIYVATRSSVSDEFKDSARLGGTPGKVNFMGSLAENDLALYYSSFSPPAGVSTAYVVRRGSVDEEFDISQAIAMSELRQGLDDMQFGHVTNDGRKAYINGLKGGVRRPYLATRDSTTEPFGQAEQMSAQNYAVEHLTGDELAMLSWTRSAGGQGRADLFLSARPTIDDEFGAWENLGAVVNSAAEETFPFLHQATSTLYFSSNRPGTTIPQVGPAPDVRDIWQSKFSFPGDFDFDHSFTATDIDMLAQAIRGGQFHFNLDTNQDGKVDVADHQLWVNGSNFANTSFGDADLNGTVEFADFLALSDRFGQEGGWAQGDFDGNGLVGFQDFLRLSASFSQPNAVAASVPEPASFCPAVLAVAICFICRRSRLRNRRDATGP